MLKLNEQRGMTLIELIVSLAIMTIVIILASSLNSFGLRSFGTSTSQADIQQQVRLVDQIIKDQVRNATRINTSSDLLSQPKELKLEDNKFYYGETKQVSVDWVENIVVTTKEAGKVLVYEIKAKDTRYNHKNQILLNNTSLNLGSLLEVNLKEESLYYEKSD